MDSSLANETKAAVLGNGPHLRYVVMGDSTALSQGGDYSQGYAVKSAEFLAQTHRVTWTNTAISGSRAAGVRYKQLPRALRFRPDVVLIAVGANDVTHFTAYAKVEKHLAAIIDMLRLHNPRVKIVLTGSPDMGSIPRFPRPVRWLAAWRTRRLNEAVVKLANREQVNFAPIAAKTGPYFRKHPEMFAADKFHPNTLGYERWVPIIIEALRF